MRKRINEGLTLPEGIALAAVVVAILTALVLLGGLVFMLLWNIALIPIVAACGGTVSKIGFWVAFGGNLILTVIQQTFRGRTTPA